MIEKDRYTKKICNFDLIITNKEQLLIGLEKAVSRGEQLWAVTLNPEFVIASKKDTAFEKDLQEADLLLPDGIGLLWAAEVVGKSGFFSRVFAGLGTGVKVLTGQFSDRIISGTDLMDDLCRLGANKGWPVYFFGAGKGTAQKALLVLKEKYPGLRGWADDGPEVDDWSKTDENYWVEKINRKKPVLLFVAFGMKKQEQFISRNRRQLNANFVMGVGGAFDYWSGRIKRAPRVWRRAGLEWFYRLLNQPWRLKRQLALLRFVFSVLRG